MMFPWILIAALFILAVLSENRTRPCTGNRTAGESNATLILEERFVRGEIDREEYLHMKQTLARSH